METDSIGKNAKELQLPLSKIHEGGEALIKARKIRLIPTEKQTSFQSHSTTEVLRI